MRVQKAARQLYDSHGPRKQLGESPRGAHLHDVVKSVGHPLYQGQSLFSFYVHIKPDVSHFTEESIFYGREITPRITALRFQHKLAIAGLLLMEAALNDKQVRSCPTCLLHATDSGSCAPVHKAPGCRWRPAVLAVTRQAAPRPLDV